MEHDLVTRARVTKRFNANVGWVKDEMKRFSKTFWCVVALVTGVAMYILILSTAAPALGKHPQWQTPIVQVLARFVMLPVYLIDMFHLPDCLCLPFMILLGPVLFVALWTALVVWLNRRLTQQTEREPTQQNAGTYFPKAADGLRKNAQR